LTLPNKNQSILNRRGRPAQANLPQVVKLINLRNKISSGTSHGTVGW